MNQPQVVVIGASAGGIEALLELVAHVPPDFSGAIFIVMHLAPYAESRLAEILGLHCLLPVRQPQDGELFQAGHIYCAWPDHHLLINGPCVAVKKGPHENRFRPSIDALFRSAAYTHTSQVIGVVLSGLLEDGTSGLWTIQQLGGRTMVQAPSDALHDSMPLSALSSVDVDAILPARSMAARLTEWTQHPPPHQAAGLDEEQTRRLKLEVGTAMDGHAFQKGILSTGKPSMFACPECHGVLMEIEEGSLKRYRCHTGHAYSESALLSEVTEAAEKALWEGVRALEEATLLLRQRAQAAMARGEALKVEAMLSQAQTLEARSIALVEMLKTNQVLSAEQGPQTTAEHPAND